MNVPLDNRFVHYDRALRFARPRKRTNWQWAWGEREMS